jgi:hypothetical protein
MMNLYVVTGTTQGLGRALAARIALDSGNELVALSRAPDGPIAGGARFQVDLADAHAVGKACERIAGRIRGKRYDKAVLINNAGVVAPVAPLERADAAELERNLAVNLVAPMLLMRGFLVATEGVAALRRIVNISSGAGRRPISGWSAYCARIPRARPRGGGGEPRARSDRHGDAGRGARRLGRGFRRRRALPADEVRGDAAPGRGRRRRHLAGGGCRAARGRRGARPAPDHRGMRRQRRRRGIVRDGALFAGLQ